MVLYLDGLEQDCGSSSVASENEKSVDVAQNVSIPVADVCYIIVLITMPHANV